MELPTKHMNSFLLVLILLSCFNLLGLATASHVVRGNDTDQQALLHFKSKITGDPLKIMDSWSTSIHFCQWRGVTCGGREHQRQQQFEREYPTSFGNLSSLQELTLSINELTGILPEALGRLTNLSYLTVGSNAISSVLPISMFNLSNLGVFDITENKIQGTLSSRIEISMPYVEFFSVGGNQISGQIPISISNATNLNALQLAGNMLSGNVPSLENLDKLFRLALFQNHLGYGKDGDFDFLCTLVNNTILGTLSIAQNNFGGLFPECISNFSTSIFHLSTDQNKIWEEYRIELEISSTRRLWGYHEINYQVLFPLTLEGFISSSYFPLVFNNLQGNIPSSLSNCQHLIRLRLDRNNHSGSVPHEVLGLSSLSIVLDLSSNYMTGELVEEEKLKNLDKLDVSQNRLFGLLPSSLGSCVSLEYLILDGNLFEGPIPSSFS
ncbi:hypothetical protein F3Y22_tig00110384pilonHSYRG00623 [Hibiscus syriacus]|uniref:Leucine-rich repeat-containing N-terminal plant-type domain-containing protein n=1 Tax=Hibiscus syriacus TaxID=106335 RepID=A0A6A3ARX9_HIBSY|nr:hypothetical protein F3Y22_tig00110384pilonHSYRG00623 [Hibiscus syriacus]